LFFFHGITSRKMALLESSVAQRDLYSTLSSNAVSVTHAKKNANSYFVHAENSVMRRLANTAQ
jgi:hypothetical protein